MRESAPKNRGFTQWKRVAHPGGYEYHNPPSMLARQLWYYVLCIGETKCPPGFRHAHPDLTYAHKDDEGFLLHFVAKGELWHELKGRRILVTAGDLVLLSLSRPCSYGNDGPKPAHLYWVWFNGKDMPLAWTELNAVAEPLFRGLNRDSIRHAFRGLIRVIAHEPAGYEARASTLLSALLAELFALRPPPTTPVDVRRLPSLASEPVRRALAHITRCYKSRLSLKELSREVGLSEAHFCTTFHRETGHSPMQFLKHYRIAEAATLLARADMTVEQVGAAVGIANAEHFSKLFRQIHGVGPREYRARNTKARAR